MLPSDLTRLKLDGRHYALDDPDDLLAALASIDEARQNLDSLRRLLVLRVVALADAQKVQTKTARVVGRNFCAVVTRPSPTWQQGPLKEAWAKHPAFSQKLLRIDRLAPNLRELNKLENAVVKDREFADCLGMIFAARVTPATLPSVKIETL